MAPATEVDHVIPRSAGGSDDVQNLQSLCKPCHSRHTYYTQGLGKNAKTKETDDIKAGNWNF